MDAQTIENYKKWLAESSEWTKQNRWSELPEGVRKIIIKGELFLELEIDKWERKEAIAKWK